MCKVRLLIVVGLLTINFKILAQIAIDATPDPSATLNIGFPPGPPRGLLIPRGDIGTIHLPPTDYLLFFDTSTPAPNDDQIYYFKTSKWISLNPWKRDDGFNLVTTTNNVDITGNLDISGYVNATGDILGANITATGNVSSSSITTTGNITATGATSTISATRYLGYTVPPGGIIMFSGAITGNFTAGVGNTDTPYEGWALCDGNNNTPDLSGKFIVGYEAGNSNYDNIAVNGSGDSGGAETVTLTAAQSGLPAHNHPISINNIPTTPAGAHSHTVATSTSTTSGVNHVKRRGSANASTIPTSTEPDHSHAVSVNGNTNNNSTANATQAHENRPPYMVLAYIMKL